MSLHRAQHLAKRADTAAKWRGHTMDSWRFYHTESDGRTTGVSRCSYCLMDACVDSQPPPNSIDISGEAIALHCTGKDATDAR